MESPTFETGMGVGVAGTGVGLAAGVGEGDAPVLSVGATLPAFATFGGSAVKGSAQPNSERPSARLAMARKILRVWIVDAFILAPYFEQLGTETSVELPFAETLTWPHVLENAMETGPLSDPLRSPLKSPLMGQRQLSLKTRA